MDDCGCGVYIIFYRLIVLLFYVGNTILVIRFVSFY